MESEKSRPVRELIRKEVPDWDDEVATRARFKAFSGQRPDWEPIYLFWRNLIISIARHLGLLFLRPSQLKNDWFNRGGLSPLCLDHVLQLMYNEGEIVRSADLVDPTTGRLSQILRKVRSLVVRPMSTSSIMSDEPFILIPVLKVKADQVVKLLSEGHWTSSCIITMRNFHDICGGVDDGFAVLSYLAGQGKARYLSVNIEEIMQGIKVSLSASTVSSISSLDYNVLHLIWTTEKLQQQLNVIDQRCERERKLASTSLKSGNKNITLRHLRALKLANESREKCATLLNRVEEVLNVIANAESTKKVSEAIQIGAQAIKENRISVEEVQNSLQELEDSIDSQKQVENALETISSCVEEEDIEEEFRKLELEIGSDNINQPLPETEVKKVAGETDDMMSPDSLVSSLSNLKLMEGSIRTHATQDSVVNKSESLELEAA